MNRPLPGTGISNMLTLYQFECSWEVRNPSPFTLKLETYLRMAGIPFTVQTNVDLRKAPKGKIPFIELDGRFVGDSAFIIDLLNRKHGIHLDKSLSPEEKAISLAFQKLIEEHLYWVGLYSRWFEEDNWRMTREAFFTMIPAWIRPVVTALIRRRVQGYMIGQGMFRHSRDEIYRFGEEDLKALADFLGEKKYFMGSEPTELDASAYGFLANLYWTPCRSPLLDAAHELPSLLKYCERMRERFGK